MNEIKEMLTGNNKPALHDLYKEISKLYLKKVDENEGDLAELIQLDYRILSLFDVKDFTLNQMKEFIDINIETFYELYKYAPIELYHYILESKNHDEIPRNIFNTMSNVFPSYGLNYYEVLSFVEKYYDLFSSTYGIDIFIKSNKDDYTLELIERIAKIKMLKTEYFNYDSIQIPVSSLDKLSLGVLNLIESDIDNFYKIVKLMIMNKTDGDFLLSFIDLSFADKLDYDKIIELYKEIEETSPTAKDDYKHELEHLIYFCVTNNWLNVFDDLNVPYISQIYAIFNIDKPNTDLIKDFNNVDFIKRLSKSVYYPVTLKDCRRFKVSLTDYFKLKFGKKS